MVELLYLKHAFGESDETVVQRWAENPYWQVFCGAEYFETRLPCDPSGLMRFRRALGDAGVEELLAKTIEAAVSMKTIAPKDLERVIVDSTVQEKAIAFPTDSRLLDVARRIHTQRPKDKNKLYALHAPEVECICKGKARQPYEFRVKVGIATTERGMLIVGARAFPGNPYDGHTLAEQIAQATILMQDVKGAPKPHTAIVDLGYWSVEVPRIEIIHRGRIKSLSAKARRLRLLKRREAVEPVIGHLKDDYGLRRNWLKGSEGDVLHPVLCTAGYNLRWLMWAIARLGLRALLARWLLVGVLGRVLSNEGSRPPDRRLGAEN